MMPEKRAEEVASQRADTLSQLQRLAMLYHARGRAKEAQEIYQLIAELKKKHNSAPATDAP